LQQLYVSTGSSIKPLVKTGKHGFSNKNVSEFIEDILLPGQQILFPKQCFQGLKHLQKHDVFRNSVSCSSFKALSYGKQVCKFGMSVSNTENITTGFLQESSIASLLFLLI
jgi:hypothetical protein